MSFLKAVAAFAEGAALTCRATSTRAEETVSAALSNVHFSVLGGREGCARSCGSVLSAVVTRFLGGGLRVDKARVVTATGHTAFALTCDEKHIIAASDLNDGFDLRVYGIDDGTLRLINITDELARSGVTKPCVIASLTMGPGSRLYIQDSANRTIHVLSDTFQYVGRVHAGSFYKRVVVNAEHLVCAAFAAETPGALCPICLAIFDFDEPPAAPFAVSVFTFGGEWLAKVLLQFRGIPGFQLPYDIAASAYGDILVRSGCCVVLPASVWKGHSLAPDGIPLPGVAMRNVTELELAYGTAVVSPSMQMQDGPVATLSTDGILLPGVAMRDVLVLADGSVVVSSAGNTLTMFPVW